MNTFDSVIIKRFLTVCAVIVAVAASLSAQTIQQRTNRITEDLASAPLSTIAGTLHPLTQLSKDLGPLDSKTQFESLTMNILLSPAQQKELNELLEAQQDPSSSQYHQWLTQQQFGSRFGLSDADLSNVKSWLAAQGFKVKSVSTSRNAITFSGTSLQVESAFHTQLRQYEVDREVHFANATELRVPVGLAGVVVNVRGLNDFRPKANMSRGAMPQFTTYNGAHFLTPGDWATIYNVTSIYNAGYTGQGTHVGVVGQTYVPKADIDHFRSAAGLSSTKINYHCISSADCTDAAGTSTDGDLGESDLDIEWAGGIAKNATVDFIYASHADKTQNVIDALQYAVQQYTVGGAVVPVLSMSYESCEQRIPVSDASYYLNVAQQASSQGQTIIVSSGDSGAAGCDPHGRSTTPYSTWGLSVGVPADVPNVTAVGGTMFSDQSNPSAYWSSSTSVVNTALQYIPETSWNETGGNGLISGGGGVSTFFPTPSWQWSPGNYTGAAGRFVPDVSFTASWDHDAYLTCSQIDNNATTGTTCTNGFLSSLNYFWFNGGTSASAPSFAGMLTLLTQKYGAFGNVNQTLYRLASNPTTYAKVFHDVTSGSNIVPCVSGVIGCVAGELGYQATTGYDLATGLGSIDGGALYTALAGLPKLSRTTSTVTSNSNSLTMGATATLTASVSSSVAGTISGTVTFARGNTLLGAVPISSGTAILSGVQVSPANGFVAGTSTLITANYSGDSNYQSSIGSTTLTLAALPTTSTTVTATPNPTMIGHVTMLSVTVTSSVAGSINGTATFSVGTTIIGTAPVANGTATLSNVSASAANGFSIGSNTITASYGGDPINYGASSGTMTLTVAPLSSTTTTLTVTPNSLMAGGTATLTAAVASTAPGTVTGTVTFLSAFGTTLGVAPVSGGTATLNITANSANWLPPGPDTVTAIYSGDANLATSNGTTTLTVTAIPTTTTVTVSPSSVMFNNQVGVTVTLASAGRTPYGYVTLAAPNGNQFGNSYVNGTSTQSFIASASAGFNVGTNTITATLGQNGDFASSTGSTALTLTPQPASTVTLTASPNSLPVGGTTTLTAAVTSTTPGTPTGTVSFMRGPNLVYAGPLSNGTLTLANYAVYAAAGPNTFTALYSGDANFASSSGSTIITVNPLPSPMTVTTSPTSVPSGGTIKVTATVAGSAGVSPTGGVTFSIGSTTVGTANLIGAGATLYALQVSAANGFVSGSNTITAAYSGDQYFTASSASTTVTEVPTYSLASSANSVSLSSGGSTSVALNLASNGYAGTVSFVASVSATAISASAPAVTLTSGGSGSATLTISASSTAANHEPNIPGKHGSAILFCAILLGAPFTVRRKRAGAMFFALLAILIAGTFMACGGGGGTTVKSPRTYTVTVIPTGTGTVLNPSPISVTVTVQ